MNTELLIFSLISLIILIPIIYFLPLKLSKKGKMTIIAVSFLIAIAGLLTKVFMQLWQSVLFLVGLVLLLSMLLTKKFSPVLFAVSDGSSNAIDSDGHEKDKEISDFTKLETLPVMPAHEVNETAGMKNEQLEPEKPEDFTNVISNDDGYMIDELEELRAFENNEEKENEVIYPSEDALLSSSLQSSPSIENKENSTSSHMELEDMEELAPIALEKRPEREEIPLHDDLSYLGELEEFMLESQAEAAAGAETVDEPEAETDDEFVLHSADEADIETLLTSELRDESEEKQAALEGEWEPMNTEEYPVFNELSDEELQVVYNEEMEIEEPFNEAPAVEVVPTNAIEDVMSAVHVESNDWNHPIDEEVNDVRDHNILPIEEQWKQIDALEEIQGVAQEAEQFLEEQHASAEENSKTIARGEVFETLLLQAEIAKKMQDKDLLKQIIESFLNYDDSDDERFNMLKTLLKDYINITK